MAVPVPLANYLDRLKRDSKPLFLRRPTKEEPKSFGVFLGGFANPPTLSQARLLSQWDTIVLDPLQEGVSNALLTCQPTSTHILGRLSVQTLVLEGPRSDKEDALRSISTLARTLNACFKNHQGVLAPFNGVLLADCHTLFQTGCAERDSEIHSWPGTQRLA